MVGSMWVWRLLIVAGWLVIGCMVVRVMQGRSPLASDGANSLGSTRAAILDERFAPGGDRRG
jgi:hypothetical protein